MAELLERDRELDALGALLAGLVEGGGCTVLVAGEAGVGKTSLIRALRDRSGGDPAFLIGACEPLSVPVPLGPLRELAEAAGGEDPAAADGGDRLAVARHVFEALAARAPAVAVIEDAHWADPTTLDVIRLLARRVEGSRVALLVTYRDDEAAANPPLAELLGDLATAPGVRRLRLGVLSEAAVRALAAPAGVDVASLVRVTGGNPFLVVEALAARGGLPATVRDATLARAGRLGPAARAAVDAAAVIGQRVPPALLEQVAPGSGAAVEEALARGVMVADGGTLGFRHELLREALWSSIPPARRAELHGRVARALEAAADPDHAHIAHHAELAGLSADACRHAAQAAWEAERMGALHEAAGQAARALRLGDGMDPKQRFELLILHSRASNFASERLEDAVESAQAAGEIADALDDPARRGRALLVLSSAQWSADRVRDARDAAQEAIRTLHAAGERALEARAQATWIRIEATMFDPALALALAPAALDLAARQGLEETRIDIEISAGLARGHLGDPGALDRLAAAAEAAVAAGLTIQTIRSHVNLAVVAMRLRRHADLDHAVEAAAPVFEATHAVIPRDVVEFYRACSLVDRGRVGEAREILSRPGANLAAEAPGARAVRALLAAREGDAGRAAELLAAAWAAIAHLPETSRHATLRAIEVETAWLRGDLAAARAGVEGAQAAETADRFARPAADLAVWAKRLGLDLRPPAIAPQPALDELAGDWRAAVRGWTQLEAPYEAAMAALPGDDQAAREAVAALGRLGAGGAARAFARARAELGARAPRGPRRATAVHPAGLTRREQEVLERMATGATNPAIAAALHLSERTVAHHVSAVLRKLDASTRLAAVERARALGLLAQDGQAPPPT